MKNNPINFDTLFNSTKLYTFQEFGKKNHSQYLTSYPIQTTLIRHVSPYKYVHKGTYLLDTYM